MCGIAGIYSRAPVDANAFAAALALLAHRGPDARGVWATEDRRVVLGCCRLAIVDLSAEADQPLAVGPLRVVHNGEIYNHVELRAELEAAGHAFRTRSDTEVLGAAFLRWGEDMLLRLNGMFASAIFDTRSGGLFLARDRCGEKPLYYVDGGTSFAFASEPKALLALPGTPREADMGVLMRFLRNGQVPDGGEETFFRAIRRLPAAHHVSAGPDGLGRPREYWRLAPSAFTARGDAAVGAFTDLLRDAVRLRLRADVPFGVTVSGGLDSSLIALQVRHLVPGATIDAFSAVNPGARVDESRHISYVAERLGLTSHRVPVAPRDLERDMDRFVWHQDEPCPHTSQYAHWKVSELAAARGVKVLLEGQGSDELFGGYHAPAYGRWWLSLLRHGDAARAIEEMLAYLRWQDASPALALRYLAAALLPRAARRALRARVRHGAALLCAEWAALALDDVRARANPFSDPLRHELYEELRATSLPGILRYVDRNSMAHSIEVRLPFLDHRVIESAFALAPEDVLDDGRNKRLVRAALAARLPAVADRADKIGFATPEDEWLRGPLREWMRERLAAAAIRPYYRPGAVERLWSRFLAGHATSDAVWRVVHVELWSARFLDRPAP